MDTRRARPRILFQAPVFTRSKSYRGSHCGFPADDTRELLPDLCEGHMGRASLLAQCRRSLRLLGVPGGLDVADPACPAKPARGSQPTRRIGGAKGIERASPERKQRPTKKPHFMINVRRRRYSSGIRPAYIGRSGFLFFKFWREPTSSGALYYGSPHLPPARELCHTGPTPSWGVNAYH